MRKLLFNYSFYSHPEIGNFRVWQSPLPKPLSEFASLPSSCRAYPRAKPSPRAQVRPAPASWPPCAASLRRDRRHPQPIAVHAKMSGPDQPGAAAPPPAAHRPSQATRSATNSLDQIGGYPLGPGPPWTRGPGPPPGAHPWPAVHRETNGPDQLDASQFRPCTGQPQPATVTLQQRPCNL
jgi:hypothetical protein